MPSKKRQKRFTGSNRAFMSMRELYEMLLQDDNREQFIRSIAHDLNSPLSNIKGCISMLESGPDEEETAKVLRILRTSIDQAEFLIRDFLDAGEVNPTEKLPIHKERVKVFREIESEMAVYQLPNRHPIEFRCTQKDMEVLLDIRLFRRAFNNLMNNAIKHGSEMSPITVRCSVDNSELSIAVNNKGRTISKSEQEKIFNRYYKIDDGRRGWGIGLAFVKEVALAHGGEVDVQSDDGTGTTFTFRIPTEEG